MRDHVTIVEDAIVAALEAISGGVLEVFPADPGEKLAPRGSAWIAGSESDFELVENGGGPYDQDEIVTVEVIFRADRTGTPATKAAREARVAAGGFRAAFAGWCSQHLDDLDLDGVDDVVIEAELGKAHRETWEEAAVFCCEISQLVTARCRTVA